MDIERILSQMTVEEKAALVSGTDFMYTNPIPRLRDAERLPEGSERDNKIKEAQFLKRIFESDSLRSMTMSSGGMMAYPVAKGFMELTNRHYLRGIRCLLSRVKVPPLPKEQSYDRDKTASR